MASLPFANAHWRSAQSPIFRTNGDRRPVELIFGIDDVHEERRHHGKVASAGRELRGFGRAGLEPFPRGQRMTA
jgi:hypothetical protein